MLARRTSPGRNGDPTSLRVLPTLWFRNTWSWGEAQPKPSLRAVGSGAMHATHPELGDYWLHCEGAPELLFTENESNAFRLWGYPNATPYVKDAFHAYLIAGHNEAVNPARVGTKAAAHYVYFLSPKLSEIAKNLLATYGAFGVLAPPHDPTGLRKIDL